MENAYRRVLVAGAGGASFYTIIALCRSGIDPTAITVWDDDTLAGGNGRLRLPQAAASTRKVDLLRGFIRVAMGDTPPQFVAARFTGNEATAGDLVIDCTDLATGDFRSPRSRKSIWWAAQANGARCLRVSYEGRGNIVVICEGLPMESRAGAQRSGYDHIPSLALSLLCGGAAATVIAAVWAGKLEGKHIDIRISIDELAGITAGELDATAPIEVEQLAA